jgi:tRNA nucleotidyltransferase (CCA-adding enzyme)
MKPFILELPDYVQKTLDKLTNAGFEAFVVGGCIRDSLLGRIPGDWDITTSALPAEVKEVFVKTIDTGIQHGTVTVLQEGYPLEITTYRTEGEYRDFRRPVEVAFTRDVTEDLKRRDFTMNAMAYHPDTGMIDPYNGRKDLLAGIIRCVGVADERFGEDALRMLRAVRFTCQLDFTLEGETRDSIFRNAHLISNVSRERVRDELNKMLLSDHPMHFMLLEEVGLMKHILPEFSTSLGIIQNNPYHVYTVGEHSLKAAEKVRKDPVLRWTMLLHDLGKLYTRTTDDQGIDHFYGHAEKSTELAEEILRRLRMDNRLVEKVCRLIFHHDRRVGDTVKAVRRCMKEVGVDIFPALLEVKAADMEAQSPEYLQSRLTALSGISSIYEQILKEEQCVTLRQLALSGRDLLEAGIPEGRAVGEILSELLDRVIEQPELNKKEVLLPMAMEMRRAGDFL